MIDNTNTLLLSNCEKTELMVVTWEGDIFAEQISLPLSKALNEWARLKECEGFLQEITILNTPNLTMYELYGNLHDPSLIKILEKYGIFEMKIKLYYFDDIRQCWKIEDNLYVN